MSGFVEYPEAAEWITTVLTTPPITGLTGGVQEHPAQELGAYPVVTFAQHAWTDVEVIDGHRVWSDLLMLVTAISKGESTKALKAIATEIDARLHRASGTTTDGQIIESVRQGGFNDSTVESGISYRRLGGFYALIVQPIHP